MKRKNLFIGREKEIKQLRKAIDDCAGGICIYGPRRVGKTALIKHVLSELNDDQFIYYECMKGSFRYNLELIAAEAARVLNRSYIRNINDIFELFSAIERESTGKHMIVVLDEYPYMRETLENGVLDSYIQKLIDSSDNQLTIILSGSYITVMKEMLEEGNPLFGRIERLIKINPFSYYDAARFYPSLSVRDKIAFYSVFGGYPFVLTKLDETRSLYENIIDNILDEGSLVANILNNVLFTEAGRSGIPSEILARIGNGKARFSDIENMMSKDVSGTLDRNLKRLVGMEIIEKVSPINKKKDRKKSFYEIKDNLIRFYFTYISPNKAMIARTDHDAFIKTAIEPSLNTFISKRFESIVREYFTRTSGIDFLDIGTYWYDDQRNRKNGEFDCVLKLRDESFSVFEAKLLKNPMTEDMYISEKRKMEEIKALDISSYGFVSSSGFDFDTSAYPDIFISGYELYE